MGGGARRGGMAGRGAGRLGSRRPPGGGLHRKFVPPGAQRDEPQQQAYGDGGGGGGGGGGDEKEVDPRLKGIDPAMAELIENEILDNAKVSWDDIAGLAFAKRCISETIILPMLCPDIFNGLRSPATGILLFGPPGTGKTMIGKAIASQVSATFFSISASTLTSKWVGQGEKMVRAMFAVARVRQPAVIFMDEIDSLLTQRSESDQEASRRLKTEFLIQLDGAATSSDDRVLVIGATNRPQELDEAARRRFTKRLYIPLPDASARERLVAHLLGKEKSHSLAPADIAEVVRRSEGYSGSDMYALCREASMGPVRALTAAYTDMNDILRLSAADVRPIELQDFINAFAQARSSVSQADLDQYIKWNREFGSFPAPEEMEGGK